MAGIKVIGFPFWVQPAHLCLISVARAIPLPVAHPRRSLVQLGLFVHACQFSTASGKCASTRPVNLRPAATSPLKGCSLMEKAHLYEALYLVNHGIDEADRGVQRLKKSPKLFMETYHKSMAGLERRRSLINLQFMLEMRELEENDESYFEEEFNVWLSDEPLTNDEVGRLMREVERQRKYEGKPPLVQFLTSRKRSKKTEEVTE
ncbi:MAG: hypothetical protein WA739_16460, partial [Candidatus Acidiferrales bacterium]